MEVGPKEFKALVQSLQGEFIIHMEFGKGEPEDGAGEGQAGSSVDSLSAGCSDPVGT